MTNSRLGARNIEVGYDRRKVIENLDIDIPSAQITVIVGANACGKSTLLRALARLLKPAQGEVILDGKDIAKRSSIDVARNLGLLPQTPVAPSGITVEDLVARGRYPHQGWIRQWTSADQRAVERALDKTETTHLRARSIDELSGGQRQRVWIALTLAQETDILLLDEPTTYLDLAHQIEVLDLLAELNMQEQRTIVIVLHELNQAARYAHNLLAMKGGEIVAQGPSAKVLTPDLIQRVFGLESRVISDPETGTPLVIPHGRFTPSTTR